jgi:hypothetical protein
MSTIALAAISIAHLSPNDCKCTTSIDLCGQISVWVLPEDLPVFGLRIVLIRARRRSLEILMQYGFGSTAAMPASLQDLLGNLVLIASVSGCWLTVGCCKRRSCKYFCKDHPTINFRVSQHVADQWDTSSRPVRWPELKARR